MVEECVQRRLAAILAADVVGYSRLTGSAPADSNWYQHKEVSEYVVYPRS